MATVTVVTTERSAPRTRTRRPEVSYQPWRCALAVASCDVSVLTASGSVMLLGAPGGGRVQALHRYFALWPALGVFLVVFTAYDLYPGIIHNAVGELRRLGLALSMSFLVLASALFFFHTAEEYSRTAFLLWWLAALVALPLLRSVVRGWICRKPWWGVPLAVLYTGDASLEIIRELQGHPEIGVKPVVILASPDALRPRGRLPVIDTRLSASVRACGVNRALIVLPPAGSGKLRQDMEVCASLFPRLMIAQSPAALFSLTMDACPLAGLMAIEVRRNLLLPFPRLAKRAIDLFLVCLGLPVVGLAICLLGLLVRLESPGPIFFGHRRVGRAQATFLAWKLRTMQVNSEQLLQETLLQDGAMREEWLRDHKLRHDPRITRLGRLLRRTSLDELPQLWNVLRGEMSLVGPRPIVEEEVAGYGQEFSLYCRVTPGMTGLWQVSGRNTISTGDRVRLDSYYVRNWSPWLDLHILARTAKAVFTGQGAY